MTKYQVVKNNGDIWATCYDLKLAKHIQKWCMDDRNTACGVFVITEHE